MKVCSREKFNTYIAKWRSQMQPYQEQAFRSMFVVRRYVDSKSAENAFATIAAMDPKTETGKKAGFLAQVERSKHSPESTPDERDILFDQLDRWVETDDSNMFRYMAGVIANNHGREENAWRYYSPLAKQWKVGSTLFRRDYGDILNDLGRKYDSFVFRRETVKHFPCGENYGQLADSYRRLGFGKESIEATEQAIALCPDDIDQWNNRASILYYSVKFEEAIDLSPRESRIWSTLGDPRCIAMGDTKRQLRKSKKR